LPWKLPNYWSAKVCEWGCLTCVGSRHSNEEAIRSAATRASGKVVVAHEANVTRGFGAEIVARFLELSENGAPLKIKRVGTPNVRIPATFGLSQELPPNAKRIAHAVPAVVK